jgi:glycosyltransferase involved in cell wall biosynthesis
MQLLSVIICTYNPRFDYFSKVIEALRNQTCAIEKWEFIIIDNLSTNDTLSQIDLSWHPASKIVMEEKPGVANARIRAVREAAHDLIVFVDDDNVLCDTYLDKVLTISNNHPNLGLWGAGRIIPHFEEQPSARLIPFTAVLALRNASKDVIGRNPRNKGMTPYGAGMAFRKKIGEAVIREFATNQSLIQLAKLCRNQNGIFSGEDIQFSYEACKLGYDFGNFADLSMTHLIPVSRVDFQYLLRLRRSHVASDVLLAFANYNKRGWNWKNYARFLQNWLYADHFERQFLAEDLSGMLAGVDMIDQISISNSTK